MKSNYLFLGLCAILISGCATVVPTIRIAAPNIINPVSMSPVVSTNRKRETNIVGELTAKVFYTATRIGNRSTQEQGDNIEQEIIKATRGKETRAIKDLEVNVFVRSIGYAGNTGLIMKGAIAGTAVEVK